MSTKFPECDSCANQDTDPEVCDACECAGMFEPIDSDESITYMSIDDFKAMFRRKTP